MDTNFVTQSTSQSSGKPTGRLTSVIAVTNAAILILTACWLGLAPAAIIMWGITDPALKTDEDGRFARWLEKRLSPRYGAWAEARVRSGDAKTLATHDLIETEWPLFGTVFYLWAMEAMLGPNATRATRLEEETRATLDACARLIADPGHAKWVRDHWGDAYLTRENAFYRMLLTGGLSAHANITGTARYLDTVATVSADLMADIDASRHGLIHDYPGECYPADVLAAIAAVKRSDAQTGADHGPQIATAIRGFEGPMLTDLGVPPYFVTLAAQPGIGEARGCNNTFLCTFAPELWPEIAVDWFEIHDAHFWRERAGIVGFREYPNGDDFPEWHYGDMDSGPVLAGFGMATSAFGVSASRSVGRFDRAYPLATQMIAASWPLPDGTLLLPRLLSNFSHAPYLGEACILFNLTRPHVAGEVVSAEETGMPTFVPVLLCVYVGTALLFMLAASRHIALTRKRRPIRIPRVQFTLWLMAMLSGITVAVTIHVLAGLLLIAPALLLPITARSSRTTACSIREA
jgi:hypothetical protein